MGASTIESARKYRSVGINVLPIKSDGSKAPTLPEWKHLQASSMSDEELVESFSNGNGIAGIGGAISGNLEVIDIDDHSLFNEWAVLVRQQLGAAFFNSLVIIRTPRPGFHIYTRCPAGVSGNQKLAQKLVSGADPAKGRVIVKTLIETKAEGGYVLLPGSPGSCHETGRVYELFQGDFRRIPEITASQREVLLTCARSFNQIVRPEHQPQAPRPRSEGECTPGDDFNVSADWREILTPHGYKPDSHRGEVSYWTRPDKEQGISASTNHNGSDYFYPFSTNCYPFDSERGYSKFSVYAYLNHGGDFSAAARALAREGYGKRKPTGAGNPAGEPGSIPGEQIRNAGQSDQPSPIEQEDALQRDEVVLDPSDPMPTARLFVDRYHIVNAERALQHQSGVFYQYHQEANAYSDVDEAAIRAGLYTFLESAKCWSSPKGKGQEQALVPFKPTKPKVENVLDALRAVCNLPTTVIAPCWLTARDINPLDMMACRNGLLHIPTRELFSPTPQFFTLNGLSFNFDAAAASPENWLRFLNDLWPDDMESIETLQEFMGYLLTPRTHLQKMLMLVGPKRSGKGTIGRVNRMLLGDRNVCGPTLGNMAEQFGLSILIGKSVGIIADARLSGRTDTSIITERLLSISGEDTLSIPRKYLQDWNGKLPTRLMLMTNELPRIEDSSGALASRFIVLTLSNSFYGREDHGLLERFVPELPGILLWALDGWDRLQARGRFNQPAASAEIIQQFEDLGSPIGAFIRDCCETAKAHSVSVVRLFDSWKVWCEENGREHSGTTQAFGRNLRAAVPWLGFTQPRISGERVRYYEGIRLKDGF